jgi:hypothetical protein
VQRGVERRAGGPLARLEAVLDLVEREGVVAERVGGVFYVLQRRLGALAVAVDRRALAEARDAVVLSSTWTTSAVSCDSREITKVSASSSVAIGP